MGDNTAATATHFYFTTGGQLWFSDGTTAGTAPIPQPCGDSFCMTHIPVSVYDTQIVPFEAGVVFQGTTPSNETELWYQAEFQIATASAAKIDVNPGPGSSNPSWFYVVGPLLYFSGDNGVDGVEPLAFDGDRANLVSRCESRRRWLESNPLPSSSVPRPTSLHRMASTTRSCG